MRVRVVSAFLGFVFALVASFSAMAQQSEIEGTITQQFEAFKVDDFTEAFRFASPNLQTMFRSVENFRDMVTRGYPMVRRPAEVRFLELRAINGVIWQKVQITDAKGFVHLLEYQMVETDEGWRIAAVQLLDAPSVTA